MSGFLDGGGLGAVGSFTTGMANMISSSIQAKKNREFQEKMYNQQVADARQDYQTQLADQWEFEKYRSAPNQAQLMREAGINPNGNGGQIATGGASSAPSVRGSDVPSASNLPVDFSGIQDSFHVLNQGLIASSQLDIQREQNRISAKNAATNLFKAQTEKIESDARVRGYNLKSDFQEIQNRYAAEQFEADIKETLSRADMNIAHSFQTSVDTLLKIDLHPLQKKEIEARITVSRAQYQKLIQEARYFEQAALTSSSQAYYYDSMARLNKLKSDWQEFQNGLRDIYEQIERANATKAEKEAAWAGFRQFASGVGDLLSGVAQGVFAFLSFKGGKSGKNIHQGYNVPSDADKSGYQPMTFEPDFENMIIN